MNCKSIKFIVVCMAFLNVLTVTGENKRKLFWADEFNYTGLPDAKKWSYEEGFVRNNEDQYYTRGRKENARVENGMLIIEARKEKFTNAKYLKGSPDWRKKNEFAQYTSASILTRGKAEWTYGRIEVRAKIPTGKGSWPAIWMLGLNRAKIRWPQCGEIDIMENIGRKPDVIHATVHYKSLTTGKHKAKGKYIIIPKPYNNFHIYAVDWTAEKMDFFVDGKKYFSYVINKDAGKGAENAFRKPFFLLINLALGGTWGKTLDQSILPLKYYIDYVRIYQ